MALTSHSFWNREQLAITYGSIDGVEVGIIVQKSPGLYQKIVHHVKSWYKALFYRTSFSLSFSERTVWVKINRR